MKKDVNEDQLKQFVRYLASEAIRDNTHLETLHEGIVPSSKAGDNSDVSVESPFGKIPWNDVSRFNGQEMRTLMLDIELHMFVVLKTLQERGMISMEITPQMQELLDVKLGPDNAVSWDDPNHTEHQ